MAGDEITIDTLRQLLKIQTELRDQAESRAYKAQRSLVSILEAFAPDEVDRRLKAGDLLDNLPIDDLELLARQQIGLRVNQFDPSRNQNQSARELQNTKKSLQQKQAEFEDLRSRYMHLEETLSQLKAEKTNLQNQLAVLNQTSTPQSRGQKTNLEMFSGEESDHGSERSIR